MFRKLVCCLLLVNVGLGAANCAKDTADSSNEKTDTGTASVSPVMISSTTHSALQIEMTVFEAIASAFAEENVNQFVLGINPIADEVVNANCLTIEKKMDPPGLVLTATGAAHCVISQGKITFQRDAVNQNGGLIQLGEAANPIVARTIEFEGYFKWKQDSVEASLTTADSAGLPVQGDCLAGDKHCFRACERGAAQCADPEQARMGFNAAVVTTISSAPIVTVSASGSLLSVVPEEHLHSFNYGDFAENQCAQSAFEEDPILQYRFAQTLVPQFCSCPTSGKASAIGEGTFLASVACSSDGDTEPNFLITVEFGGNDSELTFGKNCGIDSVQFCASSEVAIHYSDINFASCGLGKCSQTIQSLLGCNSDCSSCSSAPNGVQLSALGAVSAQSTFVDSFYQSLGLTTQGLADSIRNDLSTICVLQ